jgi:hypothetical protein
VNDFHGTYTGYGHFGDGHVLYLDWSQKLCVIKKLDFALIQVMAEEGCEKKERTPRDSAERFKETTRGAQKHEGLVCQSGEQVGCQNLVAAVHLYVSP